MKLTRRQEEILWAMAMSTAGVRRKVWSTRVQVGDGDDTAMRSTVDGLLERRLCTREAEVDGVIRYRLSRLGERALEAAPSGRMSSVALGGKR